VWDCAGQEKLGGLRDGYYVQANCAIVMFDLTSPESFKNVKTWVAQLAKVIPHTSPVVLCGNKVDVLDRQVSPKQIKIGLSKYRKVFRSLMYYDISAKSKYNSERPFLHLARALTGNPLVLIE